MLPQSPPSSGQPSGPSPSKSQPESGTTVDPDPVSSVDSSIEYFFLHLETQLSSPWTIIYDVSGSISLRGRGDIHIKYLGRKISLETPYNTCWVDYKGGFLYSPGLWPFREELRLWRPMYGAEPRGPFAGYRYTNKYVSEFVEAEYSNYIVQRLDINRLSPPYQKAFYELAVVVGTTVAVLKYIQMYGGLVPQYI